MRQGGISLFQFHEGPIKTRIAQAVIMPIPCFNSMKVRLKPVSIENTLFVLWFQFHEGPIKTGIFKTKCEVKGCFNSMKVRLKLYQFKGRVVCAKKFQFHEGPIKTGGVGPYARRVRCFNSMKVRLKPDVPATPAKWTLVSIP